MDRAPSRAAAMILPRSPDWALKTWTMYVVNDMKYSRFVSLLKANLSTGYLKTPQGKL
jgi:hypothetical protein